MKAEEFPKLSEYETANMKEAAEKDLPLTFRTGLSLLINKEIIRIEDYEHTHSPDKDTKQEIRRLRKLDLSKVYEKLKNKLEGGQSLEVIALFDMLVGYLERDVDQLYEEMPRMSLSLWKSEYVRLIELQERYGRHRDRLLEEVPELRATYTKEDFAEWAKDSLSAQEEILKSVESKKANESFLDTVKMVYGALDKAFSGETLNEGEKVFLVAQIDNEARYYRDFVRVLLLSYLLGEPYDVKDHQRLLDLEKQILKFRQFKVQVESGEWVKVHSSV